MVYIVSQLYALDREININGSNDFNSMYKG